MFFFYLPNISILATSVTRPLLEPYGGLKQGNQVVNCTLKTPWCPRTQIWNQNSKKKIFPLPIFAFLNTPEPFQITDISRKHKKKLREWNMNEHIEEYELMNNTHRPTHPKWILPKWKAISAKFTFCAVSH